VFGRASTLGSALLVFNKITTNKGVPFIDFTNLFYPIIGLVMLILSDFRNEFFPQKLLAFENKSKIIRFISYIFILSLILLGLSDNNADFIYFKF
jgi:hypothetical protein